MRLPVLNTQHPQFPDPNFALDDPDGLLAMGGNLLPTTLLSAYYQGIFPWYSDGDPILWWSPSTRCVLIPSELHISKSLGKQLRKNNYQVSLNKAFEAVINACARRKSDQGTWINQDMIEAYSELHKMDRAHSVEVWDGDSLIGGIYGIEVGGLFCGESMFSRQPNASKIALTYICNYMINIGIKMIDCQLVNDHLLSLGAKAISRDDFLSDLKRLRDHKVQWTTAKNIDLKDLDKFW